MKILVSGTRHESSEIRSEVEYCLEGALHEYVDLFLIIGDAKGVDTYAREWAEKRRVNHSVFYADWDAYGNPAGPIRNREMFRENPDLVMCFIAPDSKGTLDVVNEANRRGIKPIKVDVNMP